MLLINYFLVNLQITQRKTIVETSPSVDIYKAITETELQLPLVSEGISAGFPSPAQDFADLTIDLNTLLIKRPGSTFYGRVKGQSMTGDGIDEGDLLVIDRSIDPKDGKVCICFIDGEFTVKKIKFEKNFCWLLPANDSYNPIKITPDNDFMVWGIVVHVIKSF